MVTPGLFKKFPSPVAFAQAPLVEIEEEIRSTGFYHNKAKSLVGAARTLIEEFGGEVPRTMAELLRLPVSPARPPTWCSACHLDSPKESLSTPMRPASPARLELTKATEPKEVEQDLIKILPQDHWIDFSHELIHHGRQICVARKPRCIDCSLETLRHSSDKTWGSVGG